MTEGLPTPFPSPILPSVTLPADTSSESTNERICNIGTPFCALRRSASYHAEISAAVSTFIDNTILAIRADDPSVDPAASGDVRGINCGRSSDVMVNLHQLFERVFFIKDQP